MLEKLEEEEEVKIETSISIDAAARVSIDFSPADAVIIPESWQRIFNETYRESVDEEERIELEQ